MRVLVTGANGFVGFHLTRRLISEGHEVIAVSGPRYEQQGFDNGTWAWMDLASKESMRDLISRTRPDQVYHLAGIAVTRGVSAEDYIKLNAIGSYYLGDCVANILGPECKFLFVSSAGVYDRRNAGTLIDELQPVRPSNAYGASKASAEALLSSLIDRGLDLRIVRPFNHTGPGQKRGFVCTDLMARIRSIADGNSGGNKLSVNGLRIIRDFTDVRDVVRAYMLAMEHFDSGEVVNVASGSGTTIGCVAEYIAHKLAGLQRLQICEGAPWDETTSDALVGSYRKLYERTKWSPEITLENSLTDLWRSGGGTPNASSRC